MLDGVGLVPGAGEAADGLNAIIYLARGDKTNAALGAAAMVPIVGWAATSAKFVKKIQKHHVIPNAVYKEFASELNAMGWLQNAGANLKKLPTPFHGNHPAYNNYVTEKIQFLKDNGMLNLKNMNALQDQLRQEINSIYLGGNYERMNDYYKALEN